MIFLWNTNAEREKEKAWCMETCVPPILLIYWSWLRFSINYICIVAWHKLSENTIRKTNIYIFHVNGGAIENCVSLPIFEFDFTLKKNKTKEHPSLNSWRLRYAKVIWFQGIRLSVDHLQPWLIEWSPIDSF